MKRFIFCIRLCAGKELILISIWEHNSCSPGSVCLRRTVRERLKTSARLTEHVSNRSPAFATLNAPLVSVRFQTNPGTVRLRCESERTSVRSSSKNHRLRLFGRNRQPLSHAHYRNYGVFLNPRTPALRVALGRNWLVVVYC